LLGSFQRCAHNDVHAIEMTSSRAIDRIHNRCDEDERYRWAARADLPDDDVRLLAAGLG
jgi:hypothetical protein